MRRTQLLVLRLPCGIRYAKMSKPATSAITPLLACSRLALVVLGCGYFLLSVALCQRLFRPRAKAAYSSRSRRWRSSSTVCQGDTRYDKNRIRSDPPSSRVHRTVPRQPYPDICSDKQPTYNMLCFVLDCGKSAHLLLYAPFSS